MGDSLNGREKFLEQASRHRLRDEIIRSASICKSEPSSERVKDLTQETFVLLLIQTSILEANVVQ